MHFCLKSSAQLKRLLYGDIRYLELRYIEVELYSKFYFYTNSFYTNSNKYFILFLHKTNIFQLIFVKLFLLILTIRSGPDFLFSYKYNIFFTRILQQRIDHVETELGVFIDFSKI